MATISEALAIAIRNHQAGRFELAEEIYRRVLAVEPDHVDALVSLGAVCRVLGRPDDAVACYRRALAIQPDSAPAHYNLGIAWQCLAKPDEAAACFRRAIELSPDLLDAQVNLGILLRLQGKPEDAVACYRRALVIDPQSVEAYTNLGNALGDLGKLDDAVAAHRRAVELRPYNAEVHNNLGIALQDCGKVNEALGCYRRAIELKPDFPAAHSNFVYALLYSPDCDPQTIYEENCRWNRQHAAPLAKFIEPHRNDRSPDRRLRIGYVSPNFRLQAESFFTVPLFSAHDHERFEIFCYSDVARPDDVTARIRACADVWRSVVGMGDAEAAAQIRRDGIDILVDLTLHMAQNRLLAFARKPAPVQVCWLAYQGTTGLTAIDYRLTDAWCDPPGMFDRFYAEESIRLLDVFGCYDPLAEEPDPGPLPAVEQGVVTFGSLNNFGKVNRGVLALWAEVLRAVERSRLLIRADEGRHRQETLDWLAAQGVAGDRVTFVGKKPRAEYLRYFHAIDISLDTVPYNGQTTTLDSLWMGVPVITLLGRTAVGRAGQSLLMNLGLPELIAETPEQFVRIAAELAGDLPRLGRLRAALRGRMEKSPLMDAPRFARNVEAAYRAMWQRWCLK